MNKAIQRGDKVYYNGIIGIVLGLYTNGVDALFFADAENQELQTAQEIMLSKNRVGDISFLLIREHFGLYNLTESTKAIFKQQRFAIVDLTSLERYVYVYTPKTITSTASDLPDLIIRRRNYFAMLRRYIRDHRQEENIQRLFIKIEDIQREIELSDKKKEWDEAFEEAALSCGLGL